MLFKFICCLKNYLEKLEEIFNNIEHYLKTFESSCFHINLMKTKKLYRSHQYCEIPSCNKLGTSLAQNDRIIVPDPINTLSCGCLPFEYHSHLPNCKFYNEIEDQPYYSGCLS